MIAHVTEGVPFKARGTEGAGRARVSPCDRCRAQYSKGAVISAQLSEGADVEARGTNSSTMLLRATQDAVRGHTVHETVR